MPAFPKTISCTPFGILRGEGQSKVWEGSISVPEWGGDFTVRIHGTPLGPSKQQLDQVSALIASAHQFKSQSASAIAAYIRSADVAPETDPLDAQTIWSYLTPWGIEIGPTPGSLASRTVAEHVEITIGFEVPWVRGVVLQLEARDGTLSDIFTES